MKQTLGFLVAKSGRTGRSEGGEDSAPTKNAGLLDAYERQCYKLAHYRSTRPREVRSLRSCSRRTRFAIPTVRTIPTVQEKTFKEKVPMRKRLFLCVLGILLCSISVSAQQAQVQPMTFWYEYTVNAGKEAEFLDLVKTVGAPVRDKLMADGVIRAWGVETPILRVPGNSTHVIWWAVDDWASVEKVLAAMTAQIAKLTEEANKAGMTKKGMTAGAGPMTKIGEATDMSKTRDYLTRDIVFGLNASSATTAGMLPYTRFNFLKVKPGKAAEYRKAWEKYNKPILDKLLADGVIMVYGLSVEEVRTDGEFTHFTWYKMKDLSSMDKIRATFIADRDRRSQEEQDAITHLFAGLTEPDASRSEVTRALMFRAAR